MAQELFKPVPYGPSTTFTGYTRPVKEMQITSEVNGYCTDILVEKGDILTKSGLIAKVDTTFINLKLEANLLAQKRINRTLQQLHREYDRYSTLLHKKSTSQAKYDEVRLQLDLNKIQLQELVIENKRLQELKKRHSLQGPMGWQIIEVFKEPGEYIHVKEVIAHLGDFRNLLIPFALTYQEYISLKKLEYLQVYLPDLEITVAAQLYRVSPDYNEKMRKIEIDLIIKGMVNEPAVMLRGGLRTQLEIESQVQPNTYLVPSKAIVSRYEAHWLETPEKKRIHVVKLGQAKDKEKTIVSLDTDISDRYFLLNPE
jgi:RND family efflux transporter MFP subunit